MISFQADTKASGFMDVYRRNWKVAILLALSYFLLMWLSEEFIPHPATLFPASGIALGTLFFTGLELWPIVFAASFLGSLLAGFPPLFLFLVPFSQTLQAVGGAYLLRKTKVDPLFRRFRDMLCLMLVVLAVALIHPSFTSLGVLISNNVLGTNISTAPWSLRYTGNVLCLLILTPFILRWFAKVRFSRTSLEILETVAILSLLIGIDALIFIAGMGQIGGISLVYFLLIPLFWTALRLRPRFVTLAMLITSGFAIMSLYVGGGIPAPEAFTLRLFQTEEFLIVLSVMFFIIVSLEEDRRLSSNLLKSQVATLENAVSRISSESSAKNDFIAILAHELRNPLAPVVSAIEILKCKADLSAEERDTLLMMEDRMDTVRRLLDDLLDISRITEGKLSLEKEQVDLNTVMKRAVLSTAHHLKERHQALLTQYAKRPLVIDGDPVRIEQIFSNLLTNASKYSNAGDQIYIELKKRDEYAEIIVRDHGIGIEAASLEHIFTPFHQLESQAQGKRGLGIGLALVRSFVEMHHGAVWAASEGLNLGSTFTVTLPLTEKEGPVLTGKSDHAAYERSSVPSSTTSKRKSGLHILVVDDNDAAAGGMGKLLELKGCSVSYAYDGEQAIEKAALVSPDLILLDIGLPDMDGYTVAKTLRARGYEGRLIALTGYSTEEARAKGQGAGFEHYLIKPAGLADLTRVIPEIA